MDTRDLDRIRFVTQRFDELQGLRYLVPLGLLLVSSAGLAPFTSWPLVLLRAILFSAALLLLFGAKRYYGSTLGEVERPRVRPVAEVPALAIYSPAASPGWQPVVPAVRRLALIPLLVFAVCLLFQLLFWPPWIAVDSELVSDPFWNGGPLVPPAVLASAVPVFYALCGSFFLGIWWLRERRPSQSYHLGFGILLSAFAVLGPSQSWMALLLCGTSLLLAGLLDHRQLVRAMGGVK